MITKLDLKKVLPILSEIIEVKEKMPTISDRVTALEEAVTDLALQQPRVDV